jgi:PTS system mannose-specific IIA component
VSIGWHEDVHDAREEIAAAIARVQGPEGVLLATDMFGGTPANLGITFLEPNKVEVVTGVNLPMLIKAANLREQRDLTEVARSLREHGRNAIWVASDLLMGSCPLNSLVFRIHSLELPCTVPVAHKPASGWVVHSSTVWGWIS